MAEYAQLWKNWYDAQNAEQNSHKERFTHQKPTVVAAYPFDPSEDAKLLKSYIKGAGTNEFGIIKVLAKRNLEQRLQIQNQYGILFGKDLIEDLECDLSGTFEKVIISLLKPLPLFLADQIKYSTKGAGTDEVALIEIFCTRDDDSIKAIKECYEDKYKEDLLKVICKETSGKFEKILIAILSYHRNDSKSSPTAVADELSSEDICEETIRTVLTSYTFPFLKKVFHVYSSNTGKEFIEIIEKKCSGESKKALKAIYLSAINRAEFYAHALHRAIHGVGTDDWALIRIIVSRCELDLGTIMEKFAEIFGKDLAHKIKSDTSGDYETTLLLLLGCE